MSTKTHFDIVQGKTFSRVVRWESLPFIYKAISAIPNVAPAQLTVPTHGLVDQWRAAVLSVKGMTEINAINTPPRASDFHKATVIDPNTIQFNDINATDFSTYKSGGYIVYYTPVDMTSFSARMMLKTKPGGTLLVSLVSPADIAIDNTLKKITITISATATAGFAPGTYLYDLELVSPGGVVTGLLAGDVTVSAEVTV